jgi:hypothetical protein
LCPDDVVSGVLVLVVNPFALSAGLGEGVHVELVDLGQLGDNVTTDLFIGGVSLI